MPDFLLSAIAFLVLLVPLVAAHEAGHYIAARALGVAVLSFSIGMGRRLCGFVDRRGCEWAIRLLPVGGSVRMLGEDGVGEAAAHGVRGRSFDALHPLGRMAIALAGPAANFALGVAVIAGIYLAVGRPHTEPLVAEVVAGSPAEEAGLRVGDRLLLVEGRGVDRFETARDLILLRPGMPTAIVVERGGARVELTLVPTPVRAKTGLGEFRIGRAGFLAPATTPREVGPLEAVRGATVDAWRMTVDSMGALADMATGARSMEDLGGPVRIAEMSGKAASADPLQFLFLAAVISINLAAFNLLPLPVLDGGMALRALVEIVIRRPLPAPAMAFAAKASALALVGFMLFVTALDVFRLLPVESLRPLLP